MSGILGHLKRLRARLHDRRSYAQWAPKSKPLPTPKDLSNEITAVIVHCGESTYDACLKAIHEQTRVVRIETVRDVHPLPASLDATLDVCQTPWLLVVDADVILAPKCVETLAGYTAPDVACVLGMLRDRVYGVIGNIRLMNAGVLKEHSYRHPGDSKYPDRKAINFLESLGLKRLLLGDQVLGEHNPYNTPYEAFRRFYGTYRKKSAELGGCEEDFAAIMRYVQRESDRKGAYFMMAGLVCAALADPARPRDYVADEEMRTSYHRIAEKWPNE